MTETEKKEYLQQIVDPLLAWFDQSARELPWRSNPIPYYVWVSEIMLQQTRVEAVKPYFQRFIQNLPTIRDLAECEEERLLKLWEGLGYYNRVRNLQKAAIQTMEEHGGELPADYEKLLKLSGIGSYTAGAIASIAFHIPVPAVDGNVLRVISRILESEEDILKQKTKQSMEALLTRIIPVQSPGAFNQALMELGALVCLPNGQPDCEHCPVQRFCKTKEHERIHEIPVREKKTVRRLEEKTVFVIRDGIHTVIRKRPGKGLLAGLYELPNMDGYADQKEMIEYLRENGIEPLRIQPLENAKHIFSHVEWQMKGYLVLAQQLDLNDLNPVMIMIEPDDVKERYPIPSAFAAYAKYLNIALGIEKEIEQ